MSLWRGNCNGIELGWKAPLHGPIHPRHVNTADRGGIGWLTGFDEWLVRCGLASNGPPGEDVYTDRLGRPHRDHLTLHGRIANQPAYYVEVRVGLDPPVRIERHGPGRGRGPVLPAPGPDNHLHDHSRLQSPGDPRPRREPRRRGGGKQLLYHCNLGPPLLAAGSRLAVPYREAAPISARAAEGLGTLETYAGPVAGFAEQVYCYDPIADAGGRTLALLYNHSGCAGIALRYNRQELPCLRSGRIPALWRTAT